MESRKFRQRWEKTNERCNEEKTETEYIYVSLFAIKGSTALYTTTQHTQKTKTKIKDRDYKKRVNA